MNRQQQIVLDPTSPVSAVRQIADQVRHFLVAGVVKPGDKLPSVRRLAIDLGVHHNTVAEAYRTLAAEGWLEIKQGKLVMVKLRERVPTATKAQRSRLKQSFGRRLQSLIAEMRAYGLPEGWIREELLALREPAKERHS